MVYSEVWNNDEKYHRISFCVCVSANYFCEKNYQGPHLTFFFLGLDSSMEKHKYKVVKHANREM